MVPKAIPLALHQGALNAGKDLGASGGWVRTSRAEVVFCCRAGGLGGHHAAP